MTEPLTFFSALRQRPPRVVEIAGGLDDLTVAARDPVNAVLDRFDPALSDPRQTPRFAVGVKDIFHLPGHTPRGGTGLIQMAGKVGAVITRLLGAGGTIAATLNLDELAAGGSGENIHHGRCLNPWHFGHLTGGSSGGSAAAVAARLVPVSLGSDAGGSIRIPAAWCGVTGHKPTYGHVSRAGALARGWSVDCIGPLGTSAAQCAALLAVIAGADPADPSTWDPPLAGDTILPGALHIGIAAPEDGDAQMRAALLRAGDVFSNAGLCVKQIAAPDYDAMNAMHQIIVKTDAAAANAKAALAHPGDVAPAILEALRSGLSISAADYLAAHIDRATRLGDIEALFQGVDLLLLPVAPVPAPPASAARDAARFHSDARYTRFANHLGLPATAFPTGMSSAGLPLGAQIVGRPFEDTLCLAAVDVFQHATDHHTRRPA
jgi:aspartyl-tRNA(Asn)/glutamyl-tRNA(Gln) amidotransferase subunit A